MFRSIPAGIKAIPAGIKAALHWLTKPSINVISGILIAGISYGYGLNNVHGIWKSKVRTIERHLEYIGVQVPHDWAFRALFPVVRDEIQERWDIRSYRETSERIPDHMYDEILKEMLNRREHYITYVEREYDYYLQISDNTMDPTIMDIMLTRIVNHETGRPTGFFSEVRYYPINIISFNTSPPVSINSPN